MSVYQTLRTWWACYARSATGLLAKLLSLGGRDLAKSKEHKVAANGYDARKALEFAVYLLQRAGGSMEKLKLSKMLYIGERDSVEAHGYPIFYDSWFSVKDGPICNAALNGIDGDRDKELWSEFTALEGNVVKLKKGLAEDDIKRLSVADMEIADAILERHGAKTSSAIRNHTHEVFSEWKDPASFPKDVDGTQPKRWPITDADMARGLGLEDPDDHAEAIAEVRRMHADDPFI